MVRTATELRPLLRPSVGLAKMLGHLSLSMGLLAGLVAQEGAHTTALDPPIPHALSTTAPGEPQGQKAVPAVWTGGPLPLVRAAATANYLQTAGPITAVWANDGGDKVTRNELRAKAGRTLTNSTWQNKAVKLFAARNEVVSFNLVLEAATATASSVSVQFTTLTGPGGFTIKSDTSGGKSAIFNWTKRDIELFYVRYLQIKGLSQLSYGTDDERHVPERFRLPLSASGEYTGGWSNRPDRNKFYPDIAVPIELTPSFTIAAGSNQSIWCDVYVPKEAPAGQYTGTATVKVGTTAAYKVPISLEVRGFTLPDTPTSKTMLATGYNDVAKRYAGTEYPSAGSAADTLVKQVMDRQAMLAHRHKISIIDDNDGAADWAQNSPRPEWLPRISGSLFTAAKGYRGPGTGVGNNVFSIATYGQWQAWWGTPSKSVMWTRTNAWENWFKTNAPSTERFLYLIDESEDYAQTQTWAKWVKDNAGAGGSLKTFATASLLHALEEVPSLSIAASWFLVGDTATWKAALQQSRAEKKLFYLYNGFRPGSGSFATEDDGIALRELPWGQYKMGVNRWMFWEATYYDDYQGGRGPTNVFKTAQTFGGPTTLDAKSGQSGWNSSNGDGVLFYPGTDKVFTTESYDLAGPIASLRLKHWRRGIQDVDYISLASKVDPAATAAIVKRMVPKALWEVGVTDPSDPTWVSAPVSWSSNPDLWEAARKDLADIIERR